MIRKLLAGFVLTLRPGDGADNRRHHRQESQGEGQSENIKAVQVEPHDRHHDARTGHRGARRHRAEASEHDTDRHHLRRDDCPGLQWRDGTAKSTRCRAGRPGTASRRPSGRWTCRPTSMAARSSTTRPRAQAAKLIGKDKVEGADAYKIRLTLKTGDDIVIYIDAERFLEVKIENRMKTRGTEIESESTVGDYRDVGGLMNRSRHAGRTEGRPQKQKMVIQKVELNVPIEDARFKMPGSSQSRNSDPSTCSGSPQPRRGANDELASRDRSPEHEPRRRRRPASVARVPPDPPDRQVVGRMDRRRPGGRGRRARHPARQPACTSAATAG